MRRNLVRVLMSAPCYPVTSLTPCCLYRRYQAPTVLPLITHTGLIGQPSRTIWFEADMMRVD